MTGFAETWVHYHDVLWKLFHVDKRYGYPLVKGVFPKYLENIDYFITKERNDLASFGKEEMLKVLPSDIGKISRIMSNSSDESGRDMHIKVQFNPEILFNGKTFEDYRNMS